MEIQGYKDGKWMTGYPTARQKAEVIAFVLAYGERNKHHGGWWYKDNGALDGTPIEQDMTQDLHVRITEEGPVELSLLHLQCWEAIPGIMRDNGYDHTRFVGGY
jgi:hypothetical protein